MDKSGQMPPMMESIEPMKGLKLERVDLSNFEKYRPQINAQAHNVLDRTEGKGFSEREKKIHTIGADYFTSGSHGFLYVALKDDRVVGFVGLNLDKGGKHATIDQFRIFFDDPRKQRVIGGILQEVKKELVQKQVFRISILTEKGKPHDLKQLGEYSWAKDISIEEGGEESTDSISA